MTTNEERGSRKRNTSEIDSTVSSKKSQLMWKNINAENLNLTYVSNFLSDKESHDLFLRLEQEITYLSGDLARVRVFGKWHNLPRQQVRRLKYFSCVKLFSTSSYMGKFDSSIRLRSVISV